MIGLAGAALVVAHGCAAFRSESELDSALEDLEDLLHAIGGESDDQLVFMAEKIGEQSGRLIETHDSFDSEFNRLAAARNVSDEKLARLVSDYDMNRRELRDELLESQDALLRAVPGEARPDVLEILNRKQQARMPHRVRET